MYARVRDTCLYFDVDGMGLVPGDNEMQLQPVLLVPHGGPGGDHSGYKATLTRLSDKAQVIYFDHRGSGRSERGNTNTYTLDNNVDDMEALRQYLGLEQVGILGASYGGIVAMAYALRYPEHISHLILVATVSDYRFLPEAQDNLRERGTPAQQAMAEHLWAGTFTDEEHVRAYFELLGPLYSYNYDPERVQKTRRRAIFSAEALNMGFRTFLRTFNLTDQLHTIRTPTLVIGGKHDWICPPAYSELIASCIPGADLRIFERSAHSILTDEPEAFLDVVRGFLTYNGLAGNRV